MLFLLTRADIVSVVLNALHDIVGQIDVDPLTILAGQGATLGVLVSAAGAIECRLAAVADEKLTLTTWLLGRMEESWCLLRIHLHKLG